MATKDIHSFALLNIKIVFEKKYLISKMRKSKTKKEIKALGFEFPEAGLHLCHICRLF
jgi:hypothetical protein